MRGTILFVSVCAALAFHAAQAYAATPTSVMTKTEEQTASQLTMPQTDPVTAQADLPNSHNELGMLDGILMSDGDSHGGDDKGGGGDKGKGGGGDKGGGDDKGGGGDKGNSGGGDKGGGNQGNDNANNGTGNNALEFRIRASASAFVNGFEASLSARFEAEDNRVRLKAEVESLNLPVGTMLNVCIAGVALGNISIDSFHASEWELDSHHGDFIPMVHPGDIVEVRQDPCGSAAPPILAAQFGGGIIPGVAAARLDARAEALFQGFEAGLTALFEDFGNNRTRLQAEVVNLNLPVGTALNFCLAGNLSGTISLDAAHKAELNLDSAKGGPVPAVKAGDVIEARTDSCGSATGPVLAARFGGGVVPGTAPILLTGRAEKTIAGFEAELRVRFESLDLRRRFSAEVENLNLAMNTVLSVCTNGMNLGVLTLDVNHLGELNLDTQAGGSVPLLVSEATVDIRQGSCSDMSPTLLTATLR